MSDDYLKELEQGAKKAIEHLQDEYAAIHTGRANVNLIADIPVNVYGQKMSLKQVANITVTDPRSMAVQAWDKGNLTQIESALRESNMSLGVVNAGDVIRVNIPELTEERRNEYVKLARSKSEEAKISVRNSRQEVMDKVKRAKNSGELSEDDLYRYEAEIQKIVEAKNKDIDATFISKEKELKEV
jgi:ribosome recycling factor